MTYPCTERERLHRLCDQDSWETGRNRVWRNDCGREDAFSPAALADFRECGVINGIDCCRLESAVSDRLCNLKRVVVARTYCEQ